MNGRKLCFSRTTNGPTQNHVVEQSLMWLELLLANRKRTDCRCERRRSCRTCCCLSVFRRSAPRRPGERPSQSRAARPAAGFHRKPQKSQQSWSSYEANDDVNTPHCSQRSRASRIANGATLMGARSPGFRLDPRVLRLLWSCRVLTARRQNWLMACAIFLHFS